MRSSAERGETTDGRVLRSERSRERIADALYQLIGEGHLEPTAQQVAKRAGIGVRTVFRLFADMDALYATINARLYGEAMHLLSEQPPAGAAVGRRATELVAERAAVFERVGLYLRATNRARGRSRFLANEYQKTGKQLRTRLLNWLPELHNAPADLVGALDQATSFEAWDRLRNDQRLARPRARAAMERAVMALVKELKEE